MKRLLGVVALAAALALAAFTLAYAAEQAKAKAKAEPKTVTMMGEIVDTDCYLAHGAMGEKHKQCAAACLAGGTPMGLLTEKGMLYLLTPPHDNKDAYNKAKEWVGDKVEVTGISMERSGMKGIEVMSAKPVVPVSQTSSK